MASEINDKYTNAAAADIDIASMATSGAGVGQQGTMIDNSTAGYQRIRGYVQVKLGTSPTGNTSVYVYAIRGDKHATTFRTDGAAATKGALTFLNAPLLCTLRTKASPSTGDVLYGEFEMVSPGPEWTIGISHDTGAALNATAGNHFVHWIGVDPQVN